MGYIGRAPGRVGTGSLYKFTETATAPKTVFQPTQAYVPGLILVYLNGVLLDSTDYVATDGVTITLNSPCTTSDVFTLITLGTYSVLEALGEVVFKSGDTFTGAVGFPPGSQGIPSVYNSTDLNTGMFFPEQNSIGFSIDGSEAVRIDSTENVLLGYFNSVPGAGGFNYRLQISGTDVAGSGQSISKWSSDATGSSFHLVKSRGSIIGNRSPIAINDVIGTIGFDGDDGINFIQSARIFTQVDDNTDINSIPGRLIFSTSAPNQTSSSERMRIDSAGRVIIGGTKSWAASGNIQGDLQVHSIDDAAELQVFRWSLDSNSPNIRLLKSRGTALGSRSLLNTGDVLGSIIFEADDGTNFVTSGMIRSVLEGTVATGQLGNKLEFYTNQRGSTSSALRLTIDSDGKASFTGDLTAVNIVASLTSTISGDQGINRGFVFQTNTYNRWAIYEDNTTESDDGSNVGSNLDFNRYSDLGIYIDTPLSVVRSNGLVIGNSAQRVFVRDSYRQNVNDAFITSNAVWDSMIEVTLTDENDILWDLSTGYDFTVTIAGSRNITAPINAKTGQKGRLRIVQDAIGSRLLNWNSVFKWAGGVKPVLSTLPDSVDYVYYDVRSPVDILMFPAGNSFSS